MAAHTGPSSFYQDATEDDTMDNTFSYSPEAWRTPTGSRPSSQHSGSNYSQPQTPLKSQFPTTTLKTDMPVPTFHARTSSLNARRQGGLYDSALLSPDSPSQLHRLSVLESQEFPMGTPDLAAYQDGWGYDVAEDTADISDLPLLPTNPRDSLPPANDSRWPTAAPLSNPAAPAPGLTPRTSSVKHSRKPSSLDVLENVWATKFAEPRKASLKRPQPPTRQSTLFDMSKDSPLTPIASHNELEQKEQAAADSGDTAVGEDGAAEQPQQSADQYGSSLAVLDASSEWMSTRVGNRVSSLYAPAQISPTYEFPEMDLDWSILDRTEEQEKEIRDIAEGVVDEATQFLLARLELENEKLTFDPKSSVSTDSGPRAGRPRTATRQTRPPSMAHLKRLVAQQDPPSIRYSLVSDSDGPVYEEPPPLTELEFWAALVQDYPFTAYRLPTLTTSKIRSGIPPPLRGVVWTSMAGARDKDLGDAFERLQHEESPYDGIINKDVGRSFPGVELFRDPEGDGQIMLGRVLRCFSLHDKDIGYCQGLGFLVGPLLMNMGEKEAFCVLVRLMEHYALRASFLPSLSGLHMRIFQFSILLNQNLPDLATHLGSIGIEPAYLSQWFLSCFAVTCPLPLLFRIYDVIFAEGANETVMRVALSLFMRNEEKMMEMAEFEDVMQLLLGRSIWDVYGGNADELVDDFTSLGGIVTHARLVELEKEFEGKASDDIGQSAGFLPDVQAAASRFLGRLWVPSHGHTPSKDVSGALPPQSAEKETSTISYLTRPSNFLRRAASKQDLGAPTEATASDSSASSGSASITSTAPTDAEAVDSAGGDYRSMRSKTDSIITIPASISTHAQQMSISPGGKELELQTEIEDLLMALSEMQREHAQMTALLQKQREERSDDHRVVRKLLAELTHVETDPDDSKRKSMPPRSKSARKEVETTSKSDKRKTLPARPHMDSTPETPPAKAKAIVDDKQRIAIAGLVSDVQARLSTNSRFSASFETRAQLRGALARTREQLVTAETQVKDSSERAEAAETTVLVYQEENDNLRAEAEELRIRVNEDFKTKQKLELTIENMQIQMRMEAKALAKEQRHATLARADSSDAVPSIKQMESPARSRSGSLLSNPGNPGGLRSLMLGRPESRIDSQSSVSTSASVSSLRSFKTQRQIEDEWPTIPMPIYDLASSPPRSPSFEYTSFDVPLTPKSPSTPKALPALPDSASLTVPSSAGSQFARRTTSLATQEVFASKSHEPIPDEALVLELVNAKTAEATARQELDELRRSFQVQKNRSDEGIYELEAALATAQMEAQIAKEEAEMARREARGETGDDETEVSEGGITMTDADEGARAGNLALLPPTPTTAVEPRKDSLPITIVSTPPAEADDVKEPDSAWGLGGWFAKGRNLSAGKIPWSS